MVRAEDSRPPPSNPKNPGKSATQRGMETIDTDRVRLTYSPLVPVRRALETGGAVSSELCDPPGIVPDSRRFVFVSERQLIDVLGKRSRAQVALMRAYVVEDADPRFHRRSVVSGDHVWVLYAGQVRSHPWA